MYRCTGIIKWVLRTWRAFWKDPFRYLFILLIGGVAFGGIALAGAYNFVLAGASMVVSAFVVLCLLVTNPTWPVLCLLATHPSCCAKDVESGIDIKKVGSPTTEISTGSP